MAFDAYIKAISKNLSPGNATEHTHRAALGALLESLEPGLTATNEPKRMTDVGTPDYILMRKGSPLGYVEAKDRYEPGSQRGSISVEVSVSHYRWLLFTADHDQTLHACFLQPTGRELLSFGSGKLRGTGGSQHRPAPVQDAAYPAIVQGAEPALQQTLVAGFYPHDLPAPGEGRARHRLHRCVHARSVAPVRQRRNLQGSPR